MRVLAGGFPMGVGPRQDLLDVQARQVLLVADAPVLLEQVGQRAPALQAAAALTQGAVDLHPVQPRVVAHLAGVDPRPLAGGRVMGVDPGQDQLDREASGRPRSRRRRRCGRCVGNCSASQARIRSAGASRSTSPAATPRSSASSRASDEPPGSPRRPRLKAASIADQVSSSAPPTGPERQSGQRPVAVRWASAHRRIRSTSSAGRFPTAELAALALPPLAAREAPDPTLMISPPGHAPDRLHGFIMPLSAGRGKSGSSPTTISATSLAVAERDDPRPGPAGRRPRLAHAARDVLGGLLVSGAAHGAVPGPAGLRRAGDQRSGRTGSCRDARPAPASPSPRSWTSIGPIDAQVPP